MRENLVALRRSLGISQVELASRLGKEQTFISRIERGERRIDVVEFYAFAKAFGMAPAEAYAALIKGLPEHIGL